MFLNQHLQQLGFTPKQSEIFILLYKFGAKPASSIAKNIGQERTNTYKYLESMVRKGLIAETRRSGVKHFFVADKNILRNLLEKQQEDLKKQQEILPLVEREFSKFDDQKLSPIPQMRFFEGKSGIEKLFEDLYNTVKSKQYLVMKMFASNTLESQSLSQYILNDYAKETLKNIEKEGINIEAYLGNGIMILENIFKTYSIEDIGGLPAGTSNINVFILGNTIYIIIYKNIPFGIRIESEEFANMFHFLLKKIGE